jgi:hypothetical protein
MPLRAVSWVAFALFVSSVAACGAAPAERGCEGETVVGTCWVAADGVSFSRERALRVMDVAVALWGPRDPDLPGWRIEISPRWTVVDGERYAGYTWAEARTIAVTSGDPDCFERSAILHEMGHAWGFDHDDPRMSAGWPWVREAMRHSGWSGCKLGEDEQDER